MKTIERNILSFQEPKFFSPIRDKREYVRILVYSAKQLLLEDSNFDKAPIGATMKLIIDKMSRLFFYKGAKYFSISFPFFVTTEGNDVIDITTYSGRRLDYENISTIISIVDSADFVNNPSLIDISIEDESIDFSDLSLLEEIFQFEPSYIRYDFDPEKENGNIHPLHHLDINYSQYGVYKLGLNQEITRGCFENLQNIKTDCFYLT